MHGHGLARERTIYYLKQFRKGSMNQSERKAVIGSLVAAMRSHGSWAGETHIQKSTLLLQGLCGVPLQYQFILYIHGPFSFDLRSELAEMRVGLYLDLEPRPPYGPSYSLGTHGKALANSNCIYSDEIEFIAQELAEKDTRELEKLSTAFFIQQKSPHFPVSEIASTISHLKPHIPESAALEAVNEVKELLDKAAVRFS